MTTLMSLFLGIDRAVINRILEGMIEDGMQDGIWSISGTTPGLFTPWVDLWDAGFYRFNQPQHKVDVTLNYSVFECGETFLFEGYEIETTTVCADEVLPIEEEVVVVPAMYSGPIPVNGDGQEYVYSAVFESNGDPSDDWQFQGQFDWDFFQGADRWYQLFIHGDGSKEISVSQTLGPLLPSGVRALIFEDMILWIIPSSELPADTPLGQVSSFVHDGTFNPATGGGDVLGANPQEPLQPVVDVGG
jgi:hypothetical protein